MYLIETFHILKLSKRATQASWTFSFLRCSFLRSFRIGHLGVWLHLHRLCSAQNIYLLRLRHSSPEGVQPVGQAASGAAGPPRGQSQLVGTTSGVVIGQLKHAAGLLQALIHVQPLPERFLLLLQLSADTPWAGDRFFFALRVEDSSTALTPAKANEKQNKCVYIMCVLVGWWT